MDQSLADRTISVRVPWELLRKIDELVARVAESRERARDRSWLSKKDYDSRQKYPATVSGLTRKALEDFFQSRENPRDYVLDNFFDVVMDEVRGLLAAAVHDKEARDTLKRLADKQEPDFG